MSKLCKEFLLHKIAKLDNGNKFDKNKMTHDNPCYNFVSRTATNNGISDFVDDNGTEPYPAGTITLAFGGSIGSTFVQPKPYYTGQNVGVITLPDGIGDEAKLYFAISLEKMCKAKYVAFADEINKHFKKDLAIILPVIENSNPDHEYTVDDIDWQYMRDRIQELERDRIQELERDRIQELDAYLQATGLNDYELTMDEEMALKGFFDGEISFTDFRVGDLFNIHPTATYKMTNDALFSTKGNTPVLSNSSVNNGIGGYCGLEPTEVGNIITFSDTTTGGDTMFYQENPFIGYSHVQGMYPIDFKLDRHKAEYFISVIRKATGTGFNYANKFRRDIVGNTVISLPTNPDGSINWEYIYIYIYTSSGEGNNQGSCQIQREHDEYLQKYRVKFGEFRVCDLFVMKRGKEAAPNRVLDGTFNMVNETSTNNGITKQAYSENVYDGNSITVSVNHATTVFYQPESFCASVNILILQNELLNKHNAQYIVSLLRKNNEQYDYNNKISKDRLSNTILKLPIKSDGTPDFDYMERYIRAMEKLVIADVVRYKNKMIETTKKVVGMCYGKTEERRQVH